MSETTAASLTSVGIGMLGVALMAAGAVLRSRTRPRRHAVAMSTDAYQRSFMPPAEAFIRGVFGRQFADLRARGGDDATFGRLSNEFSEFDFWGQLSRQRACQVLDAARDTPLYGEVVAYIATACRVESPALQGR